MFHPPSGDPVVGGQEVAHQSQDLHDRVLGHADAVAEGHLGHGDAPGDRRVQVDMVGTDAGGDRQLQVRRLGDPLGGQVGRPERLGDDDIGVGQLSLEDRVGPLLVGGHHQRVAVCFEEPAQAELAGDAAEQLAGREVDGLRGRQRLPVGIAGKRRDPVPRVGRADTRHGSGYRTQRILAMRVLLGSWLPRRVPRRGHYQNPLFRARCPRRSADLVISETDRPTEGRFLAHDSSSTVIRQGFLTR